MNAPVLTRRLHLTLAELLLVRLILQLLLSAEDGAAGSRLAALGSLGVMLDLLPFLRLITYHPLYNVVYKLLSVSSTDF